VNSANLRISGQPPDSIRHGSTIQAHGSRTSTG
jgi:hypothetical protein